ncbi:MAG: HAD-IA family hydrolase [Proteobacteria bacterium]|nr:HAD-IA family hydrolase [Pseudomonadota bacterium]
MRTTLVFDLDGTLAETAPDIMGTLNHLLVQEGLAPLPVSKARDLVGAGARALLERGFKVSGRPLLPERLEALFQDFLVHYLDHIADLSFLFEGVEPALERLKARGFTLAVCTNKPEQHSHALLKRLGVHEQFAAIAGRETFPFFKPDPRHLTETIRLAGGEGQRAIMIGDSRTDVDTARAAGIPVIGVTFGYTDVPIEALNPDKVISHFDALDTAIDALLS